MVGYRASSKAIRWEPDSSSVDLYVHSQKQYTFYWLKIEDSTYAPAPTIAAARVASAQPEAPGAGSIDEISETTIMDSPAFA